MKKNKPTGFYFMFSVIILYLIVAFYDFGLFMSSLFFLKEILINILPVFMLIIIFMALVNMYFDNKKIVKYFGKKSGTKGWLIAVFAGILSSGPIYSWYPLLKELKEKGAKSGLIAVFLYNRAIKLPLLPLLVLYFGYSYALVLTIVVIGASLLQGVVLEELL